MAPGARSKFGAPIFEPEFFRKQMYCVDESTCANFGTFRPAAMIRRPGNCAPLCPLTWRSCAESKGTWSTIPPSRHRHKSTTKDSNTNTKIQKISTVTITIAFHCNNSNRISAFRIALHSNPQKNGWWSYWTSDLTWKRSHRAFRNLTISSLRLYALIEILNQILSLNSVMATITECCL